MRQENQDQQIAARAFGAEAAGEHTMIDGRAARNQPGASDGPRIWRSYVFEAKPRIASRVMAVAIKGARRECELEALLANCAVRDGAGTARAYLSDDPVRIAYVSNERAHWWPSRRCAYVAVITGTAQGVLGFENRLESIDILSARDVAQADASFSIRPPINYPSGFHYREYSWVRDRVTEQTDAWCTVYRRLLLEQFPLTERLTLLPGYRLVGLNAGGPVGEILRLYEGTLRNCAGGTVLSREIQFR